MPPKGAPFLPGTDDSSSGDAAAMCTRLLALLPGSGFPGTGWPASLHPLARGKPQQLRLSKRLEAGLWVPGAKA